MHLVVMVGELFLLVHESFYIQWTLEFSDRFCGAFGKSKDRAISMSLFYMHL